MIGIGLNFTPLSILKRDIKKDETNELKEAIKNRVIPGSKTG